MNKDCEEISLMINNYRKKYSKPFEEIKTAKQPIVVIQEKAERDRSRSRSKEKKK